MTMTDVNAQTMRTLLKAIANGLVWGWAIGCALLWLIWFNPGGWQDIFR